MLSMPEVRQLYKPSLLSAVFVLLQILAAAPLTGQDSSGTEVSSLIDDVWHLYQPAKEVVAAGKALEQLARSKPAMPPEPRLPEMPSVPKHEEPITRDEFETRKEFAVRLAKWKQEEASRYERRLANYKQRCLAVERERERLLAEHAEREASYDRRVAQWAVALRRAQEQLRAATEAARPKRVVYKPLNYIGRPLFLGYTLDRKELPRFNIDGLYFGDIQFTAPSFSQAREGDDTAIASFSGIGWDRVRIACDNRDVAKHFKEEFLAGNVSIHWLAEPTFVDFESPIVVKPATITPSRTREEIDQQAITNRILATTILMAMAAAGKEPEGPIYFPPIGKKKVVTPERVNPAVTRPGVKFKFELDAIDMFARDQYGRMISGISFVPLDRSRVVEVVEVLKTAQRAARLLRPGDTILEVQGKDVRSLIPVDRKLMVTVSEVVEFAQPSARVLRPGDTILEVAGERFRDHIGFVELVKAQPAGSSFTVTYHEASTGERKSITARGGAPLGVRVGTVFSRQFEDVIGFEPTSSSFAVTYREAATGRRKTITARADVPFGVQVRTAYRKTTDAEPDVIPDRPSWMSDIQYSAYWGYCFRAQKGGQDIPTPEQWRDLNSLDESVP